MTTLYSEQWKNGMVAHTAIKPTRSDGSQYDGMRVLLRGPMLGAEACASPLGIDAYPESDSLQLLNPFAGSTREFVTFADGLAWLEQDLPAEDVELRHTDPMDPTDRITGDGKPRMTWCKTKEEVKNG